MRIAALAIGDGKQPLIEVGPGTGALTKALVAQGATPRLIEIDPDMVEILTANPLYSALEIIQADALEYIYPSLCDEQWVATGNLPYNIGTTLIMQWIESDFAPQRIVVMLQRDVADRLTAQKRTPAYGSLSINAQLTMKISQALILGPKAFYPKPKIESAVVVFEQRTEPLVERIYLTKTREIARAAFAYRRKTLANSLMFAKGYSRGQVNELLNALGLDLLVRGEELDIATFGALAKHIHTLEAGRQP